MDLKWAMYIFDMDGTIIDAMEDHAAIFSELLYKNYSVPIQEAQRYYFNSAGLPLDEQFSGCVNTFTGKSLVDKHVSHLVSSFCHKLSKVTARPFPSAKSTLIKLKNLNKKLILISGSSPEIVCAKITSCHFHELFDLTLGTDYQSASMRKGIPHLDFIKQHFHLNHDFIQNRLVLIGDAASDISLGKSYGISTVGISNKFNKNDVIFKSADFIISDLKDLLTLGNYN